MKDKLEHTYGNYCYSSKSLSLIDLHEWLIFIDDEHFSKITDKLYKKHESSKVLKLLDSLRLVVRIEPSQNCKNVVSYIRSMSASEILAAAVSFGVTRTRVEKFTESLCSMARVVYGQHIPFVIIDDRNEAGIMDSPVEKSRKEVYAENGIPDIQDLALTGSLTINDVIQWRALRKKLNLHQDEAFNEGLIAIDYLLGQIGSAPDQKNTCQQLYAFCPHLNNKLNQIPAEPENATIIINSEESDLQM